MPHVIVALDKPGSASLRTELRPAHLEHLTRHAAKLLAAGPMLAEDGTTPVGSMIVLDSDDRAEVDAFIDADPYTKGGLFETVTVRPWRKVFLAGARTG
ncbi:YciI family protein [Benzoatithermus flavus]|uniref:YciI family protein n=1 Tax=Benzoatithermus flavus TaxID=3108223 RepID=A0ABU8XTY8_9PROT